MEQRSFGALGTLAKLSFGQSRLGKVTGGISNVASKVIHPISTARNAAISKIGKSMITPKGTKGPVSIGSAAKGIGQSVFRHRKSLGAVIGGTIASQQAKKTAGDQAYNQVIAQGGTPQQAEAARQSARSRSQLGAALSGAAVGAYAGKHIGNALDAASGGRISSASKYGTAKDLASHGTANKSLTNKNARNLKKKINKATSVTQRNEIRRDTLKGINKAKQSASEQIRNNTRAALDLKKQAQETRKQGGFLNNLKANLMDRKASKMNKLNDNIRSQTERATTKMRTATGMNQKYLQMWKKQNLTQEQINQKIAQKKAMGMWSLVYDKENKTFSIN